MSNKIYLVLDTNVVIGKRRELVEKLSCYRGDIVICLPQIPVDEILGRSLYDLTCKRDDRTDTFLQRLNDISVEIRCHGFDVEVILVALLVGASRLGFGYVVDEDAESFLSKSIQYYVGKGGRYYAVLRNIVYCSSRSEQTHYIGNTGSYIEVFTWALRTCCDLQDPSCGSHCEALYGVLGDVLILSAAYYVYRFHHATTVIVSDDRFLCEVARMLTKDGYFDENSVTCVPSENVQRAVEALR